MGFSSIKPYLNPFYHSQEDEEPDRVVKHELDVAQGGKDYSPNVEKESRAHPPAEVSSLNDDVNHEFQGGVQKAEAITLVWSKKALYLTYVWIYVVYFVLALMASITGYMGPYAYADFSSSNLISVSSVMASIIGGVLRLPTAKVIDLWGRAQGFMLMIVICLIGLIIFASSNSVATYAAANVIYYIGYDGMYYILTVFIADTTRLKNRVLILSIMQTPFICTAFSTPYAVASLVGYGPNGWRWGYGAFAIAMPVACFPLSLVFLYYQRKAEKQGILQKERSGRSFGQTISHYFIEFDMIGCFLIMAGFVLFLLPFNLASSSGADWKKASNIAMLVVGFVLLCIFPFWEKYGARKQYLPWWLLKDRTVFGAALCIGSLYVAFYCWDLYYYYFNLVVLNVSTTNAVYMGEIYTVGSCFFCVITGFLVKWTKRYKWIALVCVPIYMLGTGLMIHFRQPGTKAGYVVMCQIFIAFAGGSLVPLHQVAALAAGTHGEFATILALLYLSSSVGGAIGDSIAGGIWNGVFPVQLAKLLPADLQSQAGTIYLELVDVPLDYPEGSAGRIAIQTAFGIAQKDMCIAATCVTAFTFISVWIWRDINLANKKQVTGHVI